MELKEPTVEGTFQMASARLTRQCLFSLGIPLGLLTLKVRPPCSSLCRKRPTVVGQRMPGDLVISVVNAGWGGSRRECPRASLG